MGDKKYKVKEELALFTPVSGNSPVGAIRVISWFNKEDKIDIRKWNSYNTDYEFGKTGCSLSIGETNTLTEKLVELGFGDKDKIEQSLKTRTRRWTEEPIKFKEKSEEIEDDTEEYYDPKTDFFA